MFISKLYTKDILRISKKLIQLASLFLRQWIWHDHHFRRHTDAEDTIDSHTIYSKHLDHCEMHDLAIQLTRYLSPDSLHTLSADHMA